MASIPRGLALAVCAFCLLLPVPAFSQQQEFEGNDYRVDGVEAYCSAEMITRVVQESATLIESPKSELIVINGPVFDALPPGVRLFVYFHTCGMKVYHDAAYADVSAARAGMNGRWLSAADVGLMCDTDALTEAGWSEVPDAARCDAIKQTMRAALQ
ncbi:MAG TPA: hypothetical protein VMW31_02925 [Devosiaceae bacterium]|nr:hypothetical protein [Devosiaceae bacterium]